jgi:hypothetical protein
MILRKAIALVALLVVAAPATTAQCNIDDNLLAPPGTPCCSPGQAILPSFPPLSFPSRGACPLDCSVESTWPATVAFTAPFAIFTELFVCQMSVIGAPTPTNPAIVAMKYARTWMEFPTGRSRQVWRFLVNTDVTYSPVGACPAPWPVPACANVTSNPPRPVHFMGHVDYAFDCMNGTCDACFSLTHRCGFFMHAPFF